MANYSGAGPSDPYGPYGSGQQLVANNNINNSPAPSTPPALNTNPNIDFTNANTANATSNVIYPSIADGIDFSLKSQSVLGLLGTTAGFFVDMAAIFAKLLGDMLKNLLSIFKGIGKLLSSINLLALLPTIPFPDFSALFSLLDFDLSFFEFKAPKPPKFPVINIDLSGADNPLKLISALLSAKKTDLDEPEVETTKKDEYKKEGYGKFKTLIKTATGHEIVVDETEDNLRLILSHPTGSHITFEHDGKIRMCSKGGESFIVTGEMQTRVSKDRITLVEGDDVTNVKKNKNSEVQGSISDHLFKNEGRVIDGNQVISIGGNQKVSVQKNVKLDVFGDMTTTVTGDVKEEIIGKQTTTNLSSDGWTITVAGPLVITSLDSIKFVAPTIALNGNVSMGG